MSFENDYFWHLRFFYSKSTMLLCLCVSEGGGRSRCGWGGSSWRARGTNIYIFLFFFSLVWVLGILLQVEGWKDRWADCWWGWGRVMRSGKSPKVSLACRHIRRFIIFFFYKGKKFIWTLNFYFSFFFFPYFFKGWFEWFYYFTVLIKSRYRCENYALEQNWNQLSRKIDCNFILIFRFFFLYVFFFKYFYSTFEKVSFGYCFEIKNVSNYFSFGKCIYFNFFILFSLKSFVIHFFFFIPL